MEVLDILVRGILIPGIYVFIFFSVPGLKEDVSKKINLLYRIGRKIRRRTKRKTVRVHTGATVTYINSFPYSKSA